MDDSALLTDLYELHMVQSYYLRGMRDTAVFDFIVRRLPAGRNFLVACGLEQVLDYLSNLRFAEDELSWLSHTGWFTSDVLRFLSTLRFTGDVDAMPEGTVFFPGVPVLRVTAPLPEAQLIESRLINLMQLPIMVASKAVRCIAAAAGRTVMDFGMRRAHGAEAALLSARASYLAGFFATATVLAGQRWGIPVVGTMAHSYIQAHDSEEQAFAAFVSTCSAGCTLLVDTYDVRRALERVVRLAAGLHGSARIDAVRIDSGDLADQARLARAVLDAGGCCNTRIVASGDLDEHRIAALVRQGAPIDVFGVGTRISTSADAPYLDCAYKLAEYAGVGRRKRSPGKQTWPGRKQVYRHFDKDGFILHDVLGLEEEALAGRPMLEPVMRGGRRLVPGRTLPEARAALQAQLGTLSLPLRALEPVPAPPVRYSPGLLRLAADVDLHFA